MIRAPAAAQAGESAHPVGGSGGSLHRLRRPRREDAGRPYLRMRLL